MGPSHHPSRSAYLNGFALAVALTVIPFAVVGFGILSGTAAYAIIAICAILQVIVHLVFFLHINVKTTPSDNILFLAFAAVLIFIMVGGTLWIMIDLHHRMFAA